MQHNRVVGIFVVAGENGFAWRQAAYPNNQAKICCEWEEGTWIVIIDRVTGRELERFNTRYIEQIMWAEQDASIY